MRMLLRRSLERLGFAVGEAGNGLEALAVLEGLGQVPDVALVDWNMPEMNGLQFVEAVHADQRWRAMTVMMVSSEGTPERIARALTAGAHEYLLKPFEPHAVVDKLNLHGLPHQQAGALQR
jgi:two-component system chemotaxis response regulator CheY